MSKVRELENKYDYYFILDFTWAGGKKLGKKFKTAADAIEYRKFLKRESCAEIEASGKKIIRDDVYDDYEYRWKIFCTDEGHNNVYNGPNRLSYGLNCYS